MKDCHIIDHRGAHAIALLHPLVDLEGALPCNDDTLNTVLIIIRPFLPDLGAGVEELGRGIPEAIESQGMVELCPRQKRGMVSMYSHVGILLPPQPTTLFCGRMVTINSQDG
jgi:hypothetical protein